MSENINSWGHDQAYGYNSQVSSDVMQQYNMLYDDNQRLIAELLDTRDNMEKANAEKDSLMKFYQNLKQQLQIKLDESDQDKKKIRDMELWYRELEEQAKSEIKHLKNKIELQKRDIEELEDRRNRQVDPEIMRIKIKKDVEAIFASDLSAKQFEIDRLEEQLHEYK